MDMPVDWLLAGPPWVAYRTRRDLLGQPEDDPVVVAARQRVLEDPQVRALIAELTGWPGTVIASHKSAGQPFHKLAFLADLGVKASDPQVNRIVERILAPQSEEGPFKLPLHVPVAYGG